MTVMTAVADDDGDKAAELKRLRDALYWVRMQAMVHYVGQAFEPQHMKEIVDLADNALDGGPVPDYRQSVEEAQRRAKEMAQWFEENAE